jgi:hypothetical protein
MDSRPRPFWVVQAHRATRGLVGTQTEASHSRMGFTRWLCSYLESRHLRLGVTALEWLPLLSPPDRCLHEAPTSEWPARGTLEPTCGSSAI